MHVTQMCPRRSHTPHHAPANRRHAANLSSNCPSALHRRCREYHLDLFATLRGRAKRWYDWKQHTTTASDCSAVHRRLAAEPILRRSRYARGTAPTHSATRPRAGRRGALGPEEPGSGVGRPDRIGGPIQEYDASAAHRAIDPLESYQGVTRLPRHCHARGLLTCCRACRVAATGVILLPSVLGSGKRRLAARHGSLRFCAVPVSRRLRGSRAFGFGAS